MSVRWVWEGGASQSFDSRQAAEDWMGREWSELLARAVLVATLMDDGSVLYEMKLTAD